MRHLVKESAFHHLSSSALDEEPTMPGPSGPRLCPSVSQGLRERSSPEVLEGLVCSLPFGTFFSLVLFITELVR